MTNYKRVLIEITDKLMMINVKSMKAYK